MMIVFEWLRPFFDSLFGSGSVISTILIDVLFVLFWTLIALLLLRGIRPFVYRVLRINRKLTKKIKLKTPSGETITYAHMDENKRGETTSRALISILRFAILFIILMIVLKGFGVDITVILASAGVLGIAIAFGTQAIVKDFISGIFILSEKTFLVGELVQIDGFTGTVKEIGLRTTKIEDWKGTFLIISNGAIGSVINYSRDNSLALVDIVLSSANEYQHCSEGFTAFCKTFGMKYPEMTETLRYLGIVESNDTRATFRFVAFCRPTEHFAVERNVRADLLSYCQENGWILAYPKVVLSQDSEHGK
jgi:small conductance mechanosensitive channel